MTAGHEPRVRAPWPCRGPEASPKLPSNQGGPRVGAATALGAEYCRQGGAAALAQQNAEHRLTCYQRGGGVAVSHFQP